MIRMNQFESEPAGLQQAQLAAIERVLRSGKFILSDEVEIFEKAWATFCGVNFCAGLGNGMEAIEIGLRALDLCGPDEVITSSTTAIASVSAIIHSGATPVLADIDPATAILDPKSVERCLTNKTKAILLIHLYGQLREMEFWLEFCQNHKLILLEDCAQAHGAVCNGRRAGAFGSWGAFSFYPTKNLGARGDAGALVTDCEPLANRVKRLRNYGASNRYQHDETGRNSRLDEIQAAILTARLRWLEDFNRRRREIAQQYFAEIRNPLIQLMAPPVAPENHVYHLFVVRCRERDRLAQFLQNRQIETLIHYPIPVHRQACCQEVRRDPAGLPNAEAHAQECLSIPCHPQLSDTAVAQIITALNQFSR